MREDGCGETARKQAAAPDHHDRGDGQGKIRSGQHLDADTVGHAGTGEAEAKQQQGAEGEPDRDEHPDGEMPRLGPGGPRAFRDTEAAAGAGSNGQAQPFGDGRSRQAEIGTAPGAGPGRRGAASRAAVGASRG